MARYFAFNTLAGAYRTSTAIVDVTTAGRFNATYVGSAIHIPASGSYAMNKGPFLDGSSSLAGTVWTRFDAYLSNVGNNGDPLLLMMNGADNAYRLTFPAAAGGNTGQIQYWNSGTSAWVNWGGTFGFAPATIHTVVIKLVINTSFELWLNGTSVASSAVAPTNGAAAVTDYRWGATNVSGATWISQVMGADYDLRDSHVMSKVANANGNYTDGTGTYTDINETALDEGTAIGLPAVGNKKSFTKTAIALPVGQVISGMVVNGRCRVGGVPADAKFLCRSSATDALSSELDLTAGYEPRGKIFTTDPNTAGAWSEAGFNAAEFGMEAVA